MVRDEWREKLPPMTPWKYGYLWTDEYNRHEAGDIPAPTSVQQQKLSDDIHEAIRFMSPEISQADQATENYIEDTINKLLALTENNPALYDFLYATDDEAWEILHPDEKGITHERRHLNSEFYVPWRANDVPRAISLELAYGYARDFAGVFRKVPEKDPLFYIGHRDTLFNSIVDRGNQTVAWLEEEDTDQVCFAPAGMAPEFRHLGLELKSGQSAFLVDKDLTINPGEIFAELPFKDQLSYLHADIGDGLKDPRAFGVGALVSTGIATYMWDTRLQDFIAGAKQVIRPGGILIMDAQSSHWVWPRNRAISFYLPMKTFATATEASDSLLKKVWPLGITAKDIDEVTYSDDFGDPTVFCYRIRMPS